MNADGEPAGVSDAGVSKSGPHLVSIAKVACVIAAVAVLPLMMPINIATEIMIFGIFAMATNLLIGTAGLYSFGQAAFFGAGGYAAGFLLAHGWTSLPLVFGFAVVVTGLLAAAVGLVSIKRVGIYFMMLTFACNQLIYYAAYSWRSVTGGEDGLAGVRRPVLELPFVGAIPFDDNRVFYAFTAVLFLVAMAFLVRVVESPFGLVLAAARQNTRRAASLGYPVAKLQLVAFIIAGAVSGIAGALFGMLYRIVPIDSVHWFGSAYVVFMVVIGGTRSMIGPALGAFVFIWLQGLLSLTWSRWPLLLGLFVVATMIFQPDGLLALLTKRPAWLSGRRERSRS
ncbi:MAG: branched-chain amino acid ABC transporter permease [Rhodopseudomonas palustris]|uniref:Branched-chain amino acid ABC transporter permease n=1 Tax=Rhodopseudomonas palustris TaxID=1076 RepID=A0A933S3D1_RHOPL|nr:branched-chain amino acid ABC transporter permease [Rhodopseudomonas palustris]